MINGKHEHIHMRYLFSQFARTIVYNVLGGQTIPFPEYTNAMISK
jgi:hypothetical protein